MIVSKVLNTCGIGESLLETKIKDLILAQSNPTLALLIRPEGVIIRITAKASTHSEAEKMIEVVRSSSKSSLLVNIFMLLMMRIWKKL